MSQFFDKQVKRIAIVTGGASGIGKAIAARLADEGINVVVSDINDEEGESIADTINGDYIHADISKKEDCDKLVKDTIARYGHVDILINNAGIQHVSPIEAFPDEQWEHMIALMLTAPFRLIKYIWPYMKAKQYGRIINIGSVHSVVASLNKSAYISAKHGLIGLTKTAALEGGEHGITVNAICPAYVRTPLVENQITAQAATLNIDRSEVEAQVFLKSAAVKRFIEPEEVAELVCYLCSDKAGAVTGASWSIDLGWTAQ